MSQTAIPYYFFRGGSSRGPYFKREDLPQDQDTLSSVLVSLIGSGHALNIDGIGGGNAVTTKVAILSRSKDDWAEIDYYFAQVSVETGLVDYKPTCGNIMVAVGPAAIEMGLVAAQEETTTVNILAVNTGAKIAARVDTPSGSVSYEGSTSIDGVTGTAAPIDLRFMGVVGSVTGKLLPTGNLVDSINGIDVTCMDVAMPMVIARAEDFGVTGYESREALDRNTALFAHIEQIRLAAAVEMGMGDCSESVTPKFGLVAKAINGGSMAVRYFMPWTTHPTLAVTGSQCLSACALTPGTVCDGLLERPDSSPATMSLEHPMGTMNVVIDFSAQAGGVDIKSAGVIRTARLLARGEVMIPSSVWDGQK